MAGNSALKYMADMGTVIGNGLLLGQGPLIKGSIGYAGQNAARAVGLSDTPYQPLSDYVEQVTGEIDRARKGTGAVGNLAETAAGVASGLGAAKLGLAAVKGVPMALRALPTMARAVAPYAKPAGAALAGAAVYNTVNGGAATPEDFAPQAAAPAAAPAAAAPQAQDPNANPFKTKQDAMMYLMGSMSLPRFAEFMKTMNIGATAPAKPRDVAFQKLTNMVSQQYQEDLASDPTKARQAYMRNMGALLQPSGVMMMDTGE